MDENWEEDPDEEEDLIKPSLLTTNTKKKESTESPSIAILKLSYFLNLA